MYIYILDEMKTHVRFSTLGYNLLSFFFCLKFNFSVNLLFPTRADKHIFIYVFPFSCLLPISILSGSIQQHQILRKRLQIYMNSPYGHDFKYTYVHTIYIMCKSFMYIKKKTHAYTWVIFLLIYIFKNTHEHVHCGRANIHLLICTIYK